MDTNIIFLNAYFLTAAVAFFINIPMGYTREQYPKFSFLWLFWIHASIPLIIFMRIQLSVSAWMMPVTISLAVIGQIIGSRYFRAQRNTKEEAAHG